MLEVRGLDAFYGRLQILRDVSFSARGGEITCLLGRNGAGKTTTLKALMGLVRRTGQIALDGETLSDLPAHETPKRGVGYVPQGRRLFADLTVAENLEIGLMTRGSPRDAREKALDLFPRLRERLNQRSGTLSGGEQQMCAMARALCLEPRLLLLDEPTEGLQPSMIALIRDVVVGLKKTGVATVLVEQRVDAVLDLADRAVFIENGRVAQEIEGDALRADPSLVERYIGVGAR